MHQFHLPNPAMVVSHQPSDDIKPELTNVKLPPIRQASPEQLFSHVPGPASLDFDMSRRPSVSSTASSGFHPSRSASPAFSTSVIEPSYGGPRSLDRLRMQAGHFQDFHRSALSHDSQADSSHTGGKASKKKRDDRKQYSKRASIGTTSSRVQKSDNEAGNRYDQALDQAKTAEVCKQGNPRIEFTAAPRSSGKSGWTLLKQNNINWDVKEDGIQPSLWNKSCVNGSAILMIKHSNALHDDNASFLARILEQGMSVSQEQLLEQLAQYAMAYTAAKDTRGEADWLLPSQRLT